jgi:hypothetical protein
MTYRTFYEDLDTQVDEKKLDDYRVREPGGTPAYLFRNPQTPRPFRHLAHLCVTPEMASHSAVAGSAKVLLLKYPLALSHAKGSRVAARAGAPPSHVGRPWLPSLGLVSRPAFPHLGDLRSRLSQVA